MHQKVFWWDKVNIKIKNKMESMKLIQDLQLNILPEQFFKNYNEKQIIDFLKKIHSKVLCGKNER